ncbi:MAG: hypothetical protein IJF27_02635, partial [Oscillospiraceae bacterium]|nr:hypothetical protein [Oscillospiraceae bacterium]
MMLEKLAHLQGFIEGSDIDPNTKEGKIIYALTDILKDAIDSIAMLEEEVAEMGDQVDDIDDDLQALEDFCYDLDEDDCDCCDCDCDDDCDCDCDCCDDDDDDFEFTYEIVCPKCENTICIDDDILDLGEITCPN